MTTCTTSAAINGHIPVYRVFIGTFIAFDVAKIFIPNGGEIMPICITRIVITPHQIGSNPSAVITGNTIGTVRSTAANVSKKKPIIT